jgi:hypothetical protein
MAPKKNKKKSPAKTKKLAAKKSVLKKKVKAKALPVKAAAKKKATPKKKPVPKKKSPAKKKIVKRGKSQNVATTSFEPKGQGARSGGQSGDLQGVSDRAGADSESVDELLEEGNSFEAEVVEGVEDAPDADEGEVTTHEVPEDDVPDEYLEKDQ